MSNQHVSISALNTAANALTITTIQLHDDDPGANGTDNLISGASAAVIYGLAQDGARDLTDDVSVAMPAGSTMSHFSAWNGSDFLYANVLDGSPETFSNDGIAVIQSAVIRFTSAGGE